MLTTITSPFACQWYGNNSGNNEEIASNRDASGHEAAHCTAAVTSSRYGHSLQKYRIGIPLSRLKCIPELIPHPRVPNKSSLGVSQD